MCCRWQRSGRRASCRLLSHFSHLRHLHAFNLRLPREAAELLAGELSQVDIIPCAFRSNQSYKQLVQECLFVLIAVAGPADLGPALFGKIAHIGTLHDHAGVPQPPRLRAHAAAEGAAHAGSAHCAAAAPAPPGADACADRAAPWLAARPAPLGPDVSGPPQPVAGQLSARARVPQGGAEARIPHDCRCTARFRAWVTWNSPACPGPTALRMSPPCLLLLALISCCHCCNRFPCLFAVGRSRCRACGA